MISLPSAWRWSQRSEAHRAGRVREYSARPFFLTIFIFSVLAAFSLLLKNYEISSGVSANVVLRRRDDAECRFVHKVEDKCAFIQANCPDEEAGIFSYLSLYYCKLSDAQPLALVIMVAWLGLLFSTIGIAASDFFCVNLSTIASLLGMSESLAGVTFLAFGNGSPDVFSTFAAMSTNSGSLAVGELIGAAGFITAVVAGSMAIVRPFKVAKKSFVRDVGFFIVAASFSIVFLYDGKLHLWECATMVGFYLFYVAFVVTWHWWLSRRRRRRQTEAAIRSHYIVPGGEEAEFEDYHDEEDADTSTSSRPQPSRVPTIEDFSNLERGGDQAHELDADEAEETRERWLGELNSNMRLSRPGLGQRKSTHTPIRPSLVGALEFRAVLASLKKSRNIQSIPINLRRYSDDPNYTTAQQQTDMSGTADPASRPPFEVVGGSPPGVRSKLDPGRYGGNRLRAVSVNDVDSLSPDPTVLQKGSAPAGTVVGAHQETGFSSVYPSHVRATPTASDLTIASSPGASLVSPASRQVSLGVSPAPPRRVPSPDRLAPPDTGQLGPTHGSQQSGMLSALSPSVSPRSASPSSRPNPKLPIPTPKRSSGSPAISQLSNRPTSPVQSLRLPPPSTSVGSFFENEHIIDDHHGGSKPLSWWPYRFVPSPGVLVSTLFPTLYNWQKKNLWEKILGIVAAPSVFLLTATLPVVETERDSLPDEDKVPDLSLPAPIVERRGIAHSTPSGIIILEPDSPNGMIPAESYRDDPDSGPLRGGNLSSYTNGSTSNFHQNLHHAQPVLQSPTNPHILQSPEQLPTSKDPPPSPKNWNRWLVILQAFTAPLFTVVIFWANTSPESPSALLRPTLIALLVSLVVLLLLLLTTTPERPPKWRVLLSFAGFVVSISWISTIANEVVGVLKALGVILNMSEAVLGLTIFAVGNSLGDLVADITVARLGYPVMALSACFGGPMLNILLGIGVSGLYMTITGAKKRSVKHPDRPLKFKPYEVEVSRTLLISGATLLVTLTGLLLGVPARKWRMDRLIGWSLVGLWVVSTAGNVVGEAVGWGRGTM